MSFSSYDYDHKAMWTNYIFIFAYQIPGFGQHRYWKGNYFKKSEKIMKGVWREDS